MTVLDLLESAAATTPEAPAVLGVEPGSTLTYAQLLDRVRTIGASLRAFGVGRSDVVLVSMPSGPEFLVAIVGVMSAAVCAPVNPSYTVDELKRLASDVEAVAIVVEPGESGPAVQLAAGTGLPLLSFEPEPCR